MTTTTPSSRKQSSDGDSRILKLGAVGGDFLDQRGHFERAGLVVEYMVNERVGVHVGYDWFRLKLKDDYTARFEGASELDIDPVDVNGELSGQLKVHGPMAGVTFRF